VIKTCGGKCGRIIPLMTVAKTHDAYDQGELRWDSPLHAFVAWLARLFDYIARFKRIRHDHRFRSDWRDCWDGLRQSEWLRDQVIAHGIASLLAGKALDLNPTLIFDPPTDYGGPCPRTPFDMNRRMITLARFAADPEAIVRKRFSSLRVSGCPLRRATRATSPMLRMEEENVSSAHRCLSSSSAQHWGSNHVGQGPIAGVQGVPLLRTRFAASMILRMTATRTTLGGLPRAVRRSAKALRPGSVRRAASAAM
jgi:hypothetical protein